MTFLTPSPILSLFQLPSLGNCKEINGIKESFIFNDIYIIENIIDKSLEWCFIIKEEEDFYLIETSDSNLNDEDFINNSNRVFENHSKNKHLLKIKVELFFLKDKS